jgi:hypothetical protein
VPVLARAAPAVSVSAEMAVIAIFLSISIVPFRHSAAWVLAP